MDKTNPLICADCGLAITDVNPGITVRRRIDGWKAKDIHIKCWHAREGYCKIKKAKGFGKSRREKLYREVNGGYKS